MCCAWAEEKNEIPKVVGTGRVSLHGFEEGIARAPFDVPNKPLCTTCCTHKIRVQHVPIYIRSMAGVGLLTDGAGKE